MAFIVSSDAQLVFFTTLFGPGEGLVTNQVKSLVKAGAKFEQSLYSLKATIGQEEFSVNLTKATVSLLKGTASASVVEQNKDLISLWVDGLFKKFGSAVALPPVESAQNKTLTAGTITVLGFSPGAAPNFILTIKAIRDVTGLGLAQAKVYAEALVGGQSVILPVLNLTTAQAVLLKAGLAFAGHPVAPVAVPQPKPTAGIVALKDAQALGQKVHGTSTGSVYHTIALSEHVRVAARLNKSAISIRTEWTDTPTAELQKLEEAGVQMKAHYGSIHFEAAGVPIERVIGAFLMGTGIQWKAVVTSGAELVKSEVL